MRPPVDAARPAPATIDQRLLLIGDAGDANPDGEPVLEALRKQVEEFPERTTVIYLGDNVYETGMPDPSKVLEGTPVEEILDKALLNAYQSRTDAERRVKAQVRAGDVPGARVFFVPGNHDWDQFGVGGWKRIQEFQRYLEQLAGAVKVPLVLLPGGGCPGPVTVDLGRRVRVIALDTQWWLEQGEKPSLDDNPTGCTTTTEAAVITALERELQNAAAAKRIVVIAAHHPLRSKGPHGGYVDPYVHLFPMTMAGSYVPRFAHWIPLPLVGSLTTYWRKFRSPTVQDMSNPVYRHMRRELGRAMVEADANGATPLLYAAGHDHSIQVFRSESGPRYLLVSGLGSREKTSGVRHDGSTLFAHADSNSPGFVKLDVLNDGRVRLAVVEATPKVEDGVEVYARMLDDQRRPSRSSGSGRRK